MLHSFTYFLKDFAVIEILFYLLMEGVPRSILILLKFVCYCTLDMDSYSIRELNLLKSTCIKDGTLGMWIFLTKAYGFISCRDILITNLDASISYDELCDEVHEMCNLQQEQPITLKWIDDEGIVLKSLIILIFLNVMVQREALKQLT